MKSLNSAAVFLSAVLFVLISPASAYLNVIDLGILDGTYSSAHSINDNGQIVGRANNGAGDSRACLFDSTGGGNNVNLGTLDGYSSSSTQSINNSGQIVGWATNDETHENRACLFDATGNGNNTDLGTLGGSSSSAAAINNNGQIVGWSLKSPEDSGICLFDPTGNGNNIDLGINGIVYSINDSGQIVGQAINANGKGNACIFDSTGGGNNIDLGSFGGDYNYTIALSNNDKDQIVGSVYDSLGFRACLFDSTGGGNNIDLNTLIDPSSGWTLYVAYGINNNGWIVGTGINPDGDSHAFLLVIPEPASAMLFMAGIFFAAFKNKKRR